jgi:hypothetical protein
LADDKRQWLTPKSDSLESFAFFLVRLAAAIFGAVALARWAVGGDISDARAILRGVWP